MSSRIDDLCKQLVDGWRCDDGRFGTYFTHWKGEEWSKNVFEEMRSISPMTTGYDEFYWDVTTNDMVIDRMIKRPDGLFGIYIWDDHSGETKISYSYRYQRSVYRFMQLLAEPPVPKDILRHIYSFVKKRL
jgi:hypothetical protein